MKKTLSIVLLVLLVFLAVACNPEVKQHTHEWVKDTKKSYAATCEKIGKDIYTCSCGETKEEVIDKLGHAWDNGKETKASCETAGVKTYTCTREACGKTKTETIPATGHSWKLEPATTATCTTPGHVEKKCTSCGSMLFT